MYGKILLEKYNGIVPNDIEELQKYVDEIKQISDRLDYNTSSAINQRLVNIVHSF